MKKNLSPYLIATSIIIASIIIGIAILASSNNTCFNLVYKELYEKSEKKNIALVAAGASKICRWSD